MSDMEAKMCLERIINIRREIRQTQHYINNKSSYISGIEEARLGLIVCLVLCAICAVVKFKVEKNLFMNIVVGSIAIMALFLFGIGALITLIILMSRTSEYANMINKYGTNVNELNTKLEGLELEKKQLISLLKKSFPNSVSDPEYNTDGILEQMKCGYGFYDACYESKRIRNENWEKENRSERIERQNEDKELIKALLNSNRAINENLEEIQRQQRYANRLAREEEFRRIDEDMKRSVNKKWGE